MQNPALGRYFAVSGIQDGDVLVWDADRYQFKSVPQSEIAGGGVSGTVSSDDVDFNGTTLTEALGNLAAIFGEINDRLDALEA